ncbi:hypothetical protein pb186bvf_017105 [Paramecium bursaria]
MRIFDLNKHGLHKMFETDAIVNGQWHETLQGFGGLDVIMEKLQSDRKRGIDQESVLARQQYFGTNNLPPPKPVSFWHCAYHQTKDFCIRILALAAILMFSLAFLSPDPLDSIIQAVSIVIAVLMVVMIGATTDYRKEKQFVNLYLEQAQNDKKQFYVTRDGQEKLLDHTDLLVGDIMKVRSGDNVTVDGILVGGSEYLEVDESMITGLSDTLMKQPIGQGKNNVIRAGTNIFDGNGIMLVLAVGEETYSNRMKNLDVDEEEEMIIGSQSPLSKALETLAKFLVFIGCMAALVMFIVLEFYMVRHLEEVQQKVLSQFGLMKVLEDFISAFMIIVLSIPEGLPLIVTLSMAFSIANLRQSNIVIRNLQVCQVLGAVNYVCFDKTGTLTKNNLAVTEYNYGGKKKEIHTRDPQFRILTEALLSSNTAQIPNVKLESKSDSGSDILDQDLEGQWLGNRLDVALMEFLEQNIKRAFLVEFSKGVISKRRKIIYYGNQPYCAQVALIQGDLYRIYLKGKSNEILQKCQNVPRNPNLSQPKDVWDVGKDFKCQELDIDPIDQYQKDQEIAAIKNFNSNSYKTISFGYRDAHIQNILEADWNEILYNSKEFVYLGTLALRDDVRQDAMNLDVLFRQGQMEIQMITGDTRINAVNTAKQLEWMNHQHAEQEIQRQSEHLQNISQQILIQQKQQILSNRSIPFHDSSHDIQGEQAKSGIIDLDELEPFIRKRLESMEFVRDPLILNFDEYVMKIRKILEESKIFYVHSDVNQKNVISKVSEILDDVQATKKIQYMNRNIQILADLNQTQKQQYLTLLNKINEATIAYVGDGNNDALSLRYAAVGIALGKTATNAVKECSGVILLEDNLDGIELCIKWGRNIICNIRRFIFFQLSFFFTSIGVMLTSSSALQEQPYGVLQIIWLSLIQDIFSAIALSTERPKDDILLKNAPIKRGQNLIDKFLLKLIGFQASFQFFATIFVLFTTPTLFGVEPSYLHGINEIGAEFVPEYAVHYTMVYHLTALFQIINLINARRVGHNEFNVFEGIQSNKPFTIMIISLIFVTQIIIYYGDRYFKTSQLTLFQNLYCTLIALSSIFVFQISKRIFSDPRK